MASVKGGLEISVSFALVCTTELQYCKKEWLLKLLILWDCSGLSLFEGKHPSFNGQPSISGQQGTAQLSARTVSVVR